MGSSGSNKNERAKDYTRNAPFNIQLASSLRDPNESTFSLGQLERLKNIDDARHLALDYLHDHDAFVLIWNSDKLYSATRYLVRQFIQIQTINAVCNGFERILKN
jgi:hypothetical protein